MKTIKFNYTLLLLGLTFYCLSACSIMKYNNPKAPQWAVGVLKTDDKTSVRILSVDGKKSTGTLGGQPVSEFPDSVNLLPGFHAIVPCYLSNHGEIQGEVLSFYAQVETEYMIRHKIKWDKSIKFWIECNGVNITTDN
ncbi:MAG: hypothetical protein KKD44_15860 [Proteobacteria bacterium]|nr:hypothetical protein [Pseudomonadota bacterium]